jgi:hypothetical protein
LLDGSWPTTAPLGWFQPGSVANITGITV